MVLAITVIVITAEVAIFNGQKIAFFVVRDHGSDLDLPIPDPGVKKAPPDPGIRIRNTAGNADFFPGGSERLV
jgi:hypothetical protein